ncbi:MAG: PIN domain-containing protein [Microbacterium sp.]
MVVSAFDSDVLIYAAVPGHPLGERILPLLDRDAVGSVLILTEVLAKPLRDDPDSDESARLLEIVSRLDLLPLDLKTGQLALALAVQYGLRAADAAHLATAVASGADRFITNNRKDFSASIAEIDVVYPDDLPTSPVA